MGKKKKAFEINFGTLLLIIIGICCIIFAFKNFSKEKTKAENNQNENINSTENITEEQVLNSVKNTLCKKNLGTVLPEHRENCIKEFGQDFWNDVVARKTAIGQARKARLESEKKFRESMKVDLNLTPEVKITEKNIIEREVKDGGAR